MVSAWTLVVAIRVPRTGSELFRRQEEEGLPPPAAPHREAGWASLGVSSHDDHFFPDTL